MLIGILAGVAVGLVAFIVYCRVENHVSKSKSEKMRKKLSERSDK